MNKNEKAKAELIINGVICVECNAVVDGDAPGEARLCKECERKSDEVLG